MLDTIDNAYEGVSNILLRMRELAVQAANGTYKQADREIMNIEMKSLESQIVAMGRGTSWGGFDFLLNSRLTNDPIFSDTLFMGSYDMDSGSFSMSPSVRFQIGAHADDSINITITHFGFDIFTPP